MAAELPRLQRAARWLAEHLGAFGRVLGLLILFAALVLKRKW